jgi:hypothetical protein
MLMNKKIKQLLIKQFKQKFTGFVLTRPGEFYFNWNLKNLISLHKLQVHWIQLLLFRKGISDLLSQKPGS